MSETAPHPDDATMDIGDHLEDLRRRMIYSLSGIVAVSVGTLIFGKQIVAWLCLPLIQAQRSAHVPAQTFTLTPIAGFAAYMKVSLIAAIIIASPWIVYQVWRFFESGLYPKERRAVILLAPFSAVMTTAGVMFMYYIMLPVSLWFLISFLAQLPPAYSPSFLRTSASWRIARGRRRNANTCSVATSRLAAGMPIITERGGTFEATMVDAAQTTSDPTVT